MAVVLQESPPSGCLSPLTQYNAVDCVAIDRPLQPFRSLRRRANADNNGLSCMLFPFFPLNPHRVEMLPSSSSAPKLPAESILRSLGGCLVGPPPRMAETDECAQRACFRMADVTVIHSVTTRATGSMATVTRLELRPDMCSPPVIFGVLGAVLWPLLIVPAREYVLRATECVKMQRCQFNRQGCSQHMSRWNTRCMDICFKMELRDTVTASLNPCRGQSFPRFT